MYIMLYPFKNDPIMENMSGLGQALSYWLLL
jgi:hypothetical protein